MVDMIDIWMQFLQISGYKIGLRVGRETFFVNFTFFKAAELPKLP